MCQVPNRDDKPKEQVVTTTPTAPKENQAKKEINKIVVDQKETGAKIKTKKLILKETFMCSCEDFYNVSSDNKVGYVFPMVIVSILPHAEFGRNDPRRHTSYCTKLIEYLKFFRYLRRDRKLMLGHVEHKLIM